MANTDYVVRTQEDLQDFEVIKTISRDEEIILENISHPEAKKWIIEIGFWTEHIKNKNLKNIIQNFLDGNLTLEEYKSIIISNDYKISNFFEEDSITKSYGNVKEQYIKDNMNNINFEGPKKNKDIEEDTNGKKINFFNVRESMDKYSDGADRFLWKGWIPKNSVGLLTSQPGVGKSWFAAELGSVFTEDKPYWMDGQEREQVGPQNILYIDLEDDIDEINHRMDSLKMNKERVFLLSEENKDGFSIEDKNFQNQLKDFIIDKQIKLVIIDSLNDATPGINENDAKDAQRILASLKLLCSSTSCTMLIIHHNDKTDKAYRGSTAWAAKSRFIITLTDKGDRIEVKNPKLNRRKSKNTLSFVIEDYDEDNEYARLIFTYYDNQEYNNTPKTTKKQRMRTWLLTEFMTKPFLTLDYIKDFCNNSEWDYKYLADNSSDIFKDQKNKIWYLKERPIDFPADCLIYENQLPIDMEEGN